MQDFTSSLPLSFPTGSWQPRGGIQHTHVFHVAINESELFFGGFTNCLHFGSQVYNSKQTPSFSGAQPALSSSSVSTSAHCSLTPKLPPVHHPVTLLFCSQQPALIISVAT